MENLFFSLLLLVAFIGSVFLALRIRKDSQCMACARRNTKRTIETKEDPNVPDGTITKDLRTCLDCGSVELVRDPDYFNPALNKG